MKYQKNQFEVQGDIYSPKSFLNNLSPQGYQKKQEEYFQQPNQQNMRNSSSNLKQNQLQYQKGVQFDRTVSMDTFQKNKENFQYGQTSKNIQNPQKNHFNPKMESIDSQKNFKSLLQQNNGDLSQKNVQNEQENGSKNSSNLQQELMKQSQQFQRNSQNATQSGAQSVQGSYKKNSSQSNVLGHRDSQQSQYTRENSNTRESQYLQQKQVREISKEYQKDYQINPRDSINNPREVQNKTNTSKDNYQAYGAQKCLQSNKQGQKQRPSSSKQLANNNSNNYRDLYQNIQSSKNQTSQQFQNFGHFQQQTSKYSKQQEEGKTSIMRKFFDSTNDKSTISDKSQPQQQQNMKQNEITDKIMLFDQQEKKLVTQESESSLQIDKKEHYIYKSQFQNQYVSQKVEKGKSSQSQILHVGIGMNSPKMQNFFNDPNENQTKQNKKISRHEQVPQNQDVPPNTEKEGRNFKEEYVEYKKLQEKLNFLESKIMHIKSNIDNTYQKEKDDPKSKITSMKNSQQIKQVSMKNSGVNHLDNLARQSSVHKQPSNHTQNDRALQFRKEGQTNNKSYFEKQQQQSQEKTVLQQQQLQQQKQQQIQHEKQQLMQMQQHAKQQQQIQKQNRQNSANNQKQNENAMKSSQTIQQQQPQSQDNQATQPKIALNSFVTQIPQTSNITKKKGVLKESLIQAQTKPSLQGKNSCQLGSSPYIYYISSVAYAFTNDDMNYFPQLFREHWQQSIQGISFSKMLKPVNPNLLEEKKLVMPKQDNPKKTLVFDLDETLIHCQESTNMPCDVILPIQFPTGEVIEAGINIRPYCMEILQELSKYYEIVVFTASHSCYANVVLDYLDPNHKYIQHRLFRENCIHTEEGVYVKDLRVLQNRSMQNIILVDNAAYSFGYQIQNGLPILPYYDNKNDIELNHLMNYLKSIHHVKDVRDVNRRLLKIGQIADFSDPLSAIQNLYKDLIL